MKSRRWSNTKREIGKPISLFCIVWIVYMVIRLNVGRGALTPPHMPSAHRYGRRAEVSPPCGLHGYKFEMIAKLRQINVLRRIYLFIIHLHLKMQMRAGGVAGIAGKRDLLSLADYIADRHEQL